MDQKIPTWLDPKNEASPFREVTRAHLLQRAERDPRVLELVARIQARSPGVGSREREWARNICSGNLAAFSALSEAFPNPQELDDVLRLAAYRADHSYTKFFQNYTQGNCDTNREQCDAITRLVAPIICELQPQVAVAYANYISDAFVNAGQDTEAQTLLTGLAQAHPALVLQKHALFETIAGGKAILTVAESAYSAAGSPNTTVEAQREIRFMKEGLRGAVQGC